MREIPLADPVLGLTASLMGLFRPAQTNFEFAAQVGLTGAVLDEVQPNEESNGPTGAWGPRLGIRTVYFIEGSQLGLGIAARATFLQNSFPLIPL
jgi:hypothetical protein